MQTAKRNKEFIKPIRDKKQVPITASCKDCDTIPKVKNAGIVFQDNKTGQKYPIMHNGVKVIYGGSHGKWMAKTMQELKDIINLRTRKHFMKF